MLAIICLTVVIAVILQTGFMANSPEQEMWIRTARMFMELGMAHTPL
jgi:hypothetical protein